MPRRTAREMTRWLRSAWDADASNEGLPLADQVQPVTAIDPWGLERVDPQLIHHNVVTLGNDGSTPVAGQRLIMGIQATVRPMTIAGIYRPDTSTVTGHFIIRHPRLPDPAFPLEFPDVEDWFNASGLQRTETRVTSFVGESPRNSYFYGWALAATYGLLLQDSDPEVETGGTGGMPLQGNANSSMTGLIYLPQGAYILLPWVAEAAAGQYTVWCREHLNPSEVSDLQQRRIQTAP